MHTHPIRKFFGLIVLFAVLIVGIFVLQFKAESAVSKNVGALRISLAQTDAKEGPSSLRNQFRVSFRGIQFTASDSVPAEISTSDSKTQVPLVLESMENPDDLSALFKFTDGSSLLFSVTDKSNQAQLIVSAKPASGYSQMSLSWKPASGYSIKEQSANRILLASKSSNYALNAPMVTAERIYFNSNELTATFTGYDPRKRFAFESVLSLPLADQKSYESTVKQVRTNLLERFTQAATSSDPSVLTEQAVVSYVAEMAQTGHFNEALDAVPDSFKRGNKRTYISSPFFDNLANMNNSLIIQTNKYQSMVSNSISTQNFDIFTVEGIDMYILREKMTPAIKTLLSLPANTKGFKPSLAQAQGILKIYSTIYKNDPKFALLLSNVLPVCEQTIAESCKIEDQKITVTENNVLLTITQNVSLGSTLIDYGQTTGRFEFTAAGYLIVNSSVNESELLSLKVLSEIYPLVCPENSFIPHTEILGYYGTKAVWAWTCAQKITYTKAEDGTADINITYPLGFTHYVIFNGIPTFHANIEIQHQKFRTDPRFETYNSSGYVYLSTEQTLFIKSRHKSEVELIKLFCDPDDTFKTLANSALE